MDSQRIVWLTLCAIISNGKKTQEWQSGKYTVESSATFSVSPPLFLFPVSSGGTFNVCLGGLTHIIGYFPTNIWHFLHIIGYSEGEKRTVLHKPLSLFRFTAKAGLQHNDWSLRCLCGIATSCRRSSASEGLALYGLEQRKWPWLLRGWLAALQHSKSTSTICTYMAWLKNEITEDFSSEVLWLKEIM